MKANWKTIATSEAKPAAELELELKLKGNGSGNSASGGTLTWQGRGGGMRGWTGSWKSALGLGLGLWVGQMWMGPQVTAAVGPVVPALPTPPTATAGGLQGQVPPIPSIPAGSPVGLFRELLAMSPSEQQAKLAARSPESRAVLERKLKEYRDMPAEEREWRLRGVEFHYYNRLLLSAPAEFRNRWLESLPEEYRAVCAERLKLWQVLPPELQKHLLARENTLQLLSRLERVQGQDRSQVWEGLSEVERVEVQKEIQRWKGMPAGQPAEWSAGFKSLFDLTGAEQEKLRRSLAASRKTNGIPWIAKAQTLPKEDRERTLDGIRRFTQLTPEQRARFLESYTRWKSLSEADREIWKRLVTQKAAVITLPVGVPKG